MSNEELAVLAQGGNCEALMTLWAQVKGMVWKQAGHWTASGRGGATVEDLTQAGFIALLRAVNSYDPDKAKFSTHLFTRLKAEFSEATGQQTTRTQHDPLQTAASLDAPLAEGDGDPMTLADIIEDPAAAAEIENAGIRLAVAEALKGLPEEQQRAVRDKYWYDRPVDQKAHAAALRHLRHPAHSRALRAFL